MNLVLQNNICLSGGAEGADSCFGFFAEKNNHSVIHWSFHGHKSKQETIKLSDDVLLVADEFLIKANETLQRTFPTTSNFVNNLLRRNYYQILDSDSCYAVSTIKNNMVQGGTAWGVQMYLDMQKTNCFVFCQDTETWYQWNGKWEAIEAPPAPSGVYAGIGSRKLTEAGIAAIKRLYL